MTLWSHPKKLCDPRIHKLSITLWVSQTFYSNTFDLPANDKVHIWQHLAQQSKHNAFWCLQHFTWLHAQYYHWHTSQAQRIHLATCLVLPLTHQYSTINSIVCDTLVTAQYISLIAIQYLWHSRWQCTSRPFLFGRWRRSEHTHGRYLCKQETDRSVHERQQGNPN